VYDECYNDDNDDVCDESKVKQEWGTDDEE
jgi:hypothetical protein